MTWRSLWSHPHYRDEALQLLDLLHDQSRALTSAYDVEPLQVHAMYSLVEVMAAFDVRTSRGAAYRPQAGVYYAKHAKTDLFFVTLEKSEKHYTPTTLYKDYPISPTLFHWETQSSCHPGTPTGRRYTEISRDSEHRALLFVRRTRKDDRGETSPYLFLGRCFYVSHKDERPMAITWELENALPPAFWQETKTAAG